VIKALKVGIIGLGHLGRYHAEKVAKISLAGLGMTERGVELKAICDINDERLEEVANLLLKGYGLKPFKTKNFEEVLSLVDAVIVATPTFTHYEIVKGCSCGKAFNR